MQEQNSKTENSGGIPKNGFKVMIVDDDKFLLDMYSLKFTKKGYDVMVCADPEEALTKLKEGYDPSILVIDIIMPKMDGIELLEKINEAGLAKNSKKIILSNQSSEEDKKRAEKIGVNGFIVKALATPSEVVSRIEELIMIK